MVIFVKNKAYISKKNDDYNKEVYNTPNQFLGIIHTKNRIKKENNVDLDGKLFLAKKNQYKKVDNI